ncbi:MAG: biotin/lipoyl-binding protein, partial [Planctomycetia bacterium]|nr:biotin/lipoyl-binding protein [Planctomycetia bacterium]
AVGVAAWWWLSTHHFATVDDHAGGRSAGPEAATAGGRKASGLAMPALVTLSAAKQAAAGIGLATVEIRPLRDHVTVPGRLDYDARHRLDYASPVDGIVSQVLVKVRQKVAKGDALAQLSSPDVGMARDEVRRREDDRMIEKKAADWATAIGDNVEALLDALASRPPLAEIEKQFQDRILGTYREKILGSYSRLIYVEKVSAGTKTLGEGGVLSGRIVEERASNLEVAKANFAAACEEARFLTRQDRDRARAALEQADRLVRISRENLRTLVGSRLDTDPAGEDPGESPGETASLSALVLRTPFDGVVEDVFIARGERARIGDRLFVVADTNHRHRQPRGRDRRNRLAQRAARGGTGQRRRPLQAGDVRLGRSPAGGAAERPGGADDGGDAARGEVLRLHPRRRGPLPSRGRHDRDRQRRPGGGDQRPRGRPAGRVAGGLRPQERAAPGEGSGVTGRPGPRGRGVV